MSTFLVPFVKRKKMETKISIASVDATRMSPYDLTVYKKNRTILTKVISLQKLWKDACTPLEKHETKRLVIKLINENCDSIEKTCAFLGVISAPFILSRLRKQLEENLTEILEKYNIPTPNLKLNNKPKDQASYFVHYLCDDLDIWWNLKRK